MSLLASGIIYLTAFVHPSHEFYVTADVEDKTVIITIVAE